MSTARARRYLLARKLSLRISVGMQTSASSSNQRMLTLHPRSLSFARNVSMAWTRCRSWKLSSEPTISKCKDISRMAGR